jgi:hypothetical protein
MWPHALAVAMCDPVQALTILPLRSLRSECFQARVSVSTAASTLAHAAACSAVCDLPAAVKPAGDLRHQAEATHVDAALFTLSSTTFSARGAYVIAPRIRLASMDAGRGVAGTVYVKKQVTGPVTARSPSRHAVLTTSYLARSSALGPGLSQLMAADQKQLTETEGTAGHRRSVNDVHECQHRPLLHACACNNPEQWTGSSTQAHTAQHCPAPTTWTLAGGSTARQG